MVDDDKQNNTDQVILKLAGWMERGDRWIYLLTGMALLTAAVMVMVYGLVDFFKASQTDFLQAITILIHNLLLVLIILEILRTIRNYLVSHTVLLEPFLHIGIIAAIRRILMAGAQFSFQPTMDQKEMFFFFLDMGVSAGVILILAISVYLLNANEKKVPA